MSTAEIWVVALTIFATLLLILFLITLLADQYLAAQNRKLRTENDDFARLTMKLVNETMRQRARVHSLQHVLACIGVEVVDASDLDDVATPADIQWGGESK